MRIVFAGTPRWAVPSLRALVDAGHDLVGVVTREDAPLGRRRILTPSPVAEEASARGLRLLKTNRLGAEATEWVRDLDAELGVIVAYGGLVRPPLLALPRLGWINLHFSDLPRWRGAAPVQRALEAGEQRLGVAVFRLVEALDAGDVLTRSFTDFPPGTSAGAALAALSESGTRPLVDAVRMLEANASAGEPQVGEATYARKLSREDGRIDPSRSTAEVLAKWAGTTPEPGAYALFEDEPLKLRELVPVATPGSPAAAGTVRLIDGRAVLSTGDGALEIARAQPAGKPEMDGAAWLRGRSGEAVLS